MKALFLSRFDSFTKSALYVANEFKSHDIKIEWIFIETKNSNNIDYSKYGFDVNTPRLNCNALINLPNILSYDFIVIYDTGGMVRRLSYLLSRKIQSLGVSKRPVLITGFPGVVFSEVNTGFTNRSMADFILFSCNYEYDLYKDFCRKNNLYFNGLLWGWNFSPISKEEHSQRVIVFADQDVIPKDFSDRLFLALKLIELAKENSTNLVILKARTQKGEKRLFNAIYPLDEILTKYFKDKLPNNLIFEYGDITDYLKIADQLVTVSSTVAIQAIMSNIPTVIISDYGINDINGTSYFKESGCLLSFSELLKGKQPSLNEEWVSSHISNNIVIRNMAINKILNQKELVSTTLRPQNLLKLYSEDYLDFINGPTKFIKRSFIEKLLLKFRRYFRSNR